MRHPKALRLVYNLYSWKVGLCIIFLWLALMVASVVLRNIPSFNTPLNIFATTHYVGSIIFGGGPVVVPLLQSFVVDGSAWMTNREFLLGLALINSLPGPNFNIGVFCGCLALRATPGYMWLGGLLGLLGIFAPGLLLMSGLIPLWNTYRKLEPLQKFFTGVNAAAVGLVFAAVYILGRKSIVSPTGGVGAPALMITDFPLYTSVAAISYALAGFTPVPAPFAVLAGGIIGLLDWLVHTHTS
jgi:chromate transport protein ChrA